MIQITSAPFAPRAGQFIMVDVQGTSLDAAQAAFLREHAIRAVCLFRKNIGTPTEFRQLTADLRAVMGPGALIGLDQEGGSVVRATFLPQAPSAMAIGAVGDEALSFEVGAAVARGLRSVGINWDFAPVLDVNNNPDNPVIAERSFSESPQDVARLAGAWMRGALSEGVACCVKHFPGHGDTHVDSHLDLPVVDKSRADLDALELLPFKALAAEAPAVMTAHIVYPQIDPNHPATLSPVVLGNILRREWGYDGVVITDSLVMKAIHERYGHDKAAVLAMQAGADMVMALGSVEDQRAAMVALQAALDEGRINAAAAAQSLARLDALAQRYPVRHDSYVDEQWQADDALMRQVWTKGLTALHGAQPPSRHQPIRVITQGTVPCDGVSEAGPSGAQVSSLFADHHDVEVIQKDSLQGLTDADFGQDGKFNVLVSNHRDRYAQPLPAGIDLHLVLWNPFQALDARVPTLVSWGYADGALAAVKCWLCAGAQAGQRPPVTLQ